MKYQTPYSKRKKAAIPAPTRRQRERRMISEGFVSVRMWVHVKDVKKADRLRKRGDEMMAQVQADIPVPTQEG